MTDVDHPQPRLDRAALEQLLAGLIAVRGGDFSTRLAPTGDPLVDEIAGVFNGMADQLDQFTDEVTRVAREVGTEGKLGGQAHVPGVSGTWEDLTDSVNAMAGNLTAQVRNIAQVATAVANGDLTQKIGVEAQGEIRSFRTFQKQPAQQAHTPEQQLHRFLGTHSGRKSKYARLLVGALDLAQIPRPLDRVLAHV